MRSTLSNLPDSSDIHCVLCCISHGEVSSIGPFVERPLPAISEHNEQKMGQTLGVVLQTMSTRSICAKAFRDIKIFFKARNRDT